jgi:hypothetical protein
VGALLAAGDSDGLNEFWRQFAILAVGSVLVFVLLLGFVAWALFSSLRKGRRLRNAATGDESPIRAS